MADFSQVTTHDLTVDGRGIQITAAKNGPSTLRLSWTLPVNPTAYAGGVVLLSEQKLTTDEFPIDGSRYSASSNWLAPVSTIGSAKVVAAFYGFFGDDITTTFVDVTNIDPNKVYYASFHAASSVLQYYTIGVQSYPLDGTPVSKNTESWAGNIPASSTPPQNPTSGQAYFDPSTNMVLVWNDQMGAWIQSSQSTVPVGLLPPVSQNQLFFNYIDLELKFFDGTQWVVATSSNLRVKMGAAWAPFTKVTQSAAYPTTPAIGDWAYVTIPPANSAPATAELKFFSLGSWFNPDPNLVQVNIGGTWTPVTINNDKLYDQFDPIIPNVGDFFYQTSSRNLMVWGGQSWVRADVDQAGVATTDKIGVGDDGNYEARRALINVLKHQIGYPQVCVELSEESFNIAINNALDEFRRRADNAYSHRHVSYTLKQNQVTYYLNDPRDKTDKIVNVLKIHRINSLGISSLSAESGLYAQAFFNQLYQGSNVDVLSIHLMNQLSETYEKIFAGNLVFTWDESTRELLILRRILQQQERVVLEVVMERTEQELLTDRWCKQWLQGWAQSELWEMLGEIRSKYTSALPGANGGITLNGDSLLTRSAEQQAELLRQITDYEVGNGGVNFGNTTLLIG